MKAREPLLITCGSGAPVVPPRADVDHLRVGLAARDSQVPFGLNLVLVRLRPRRHRVLAQMAIELADPLARSRKALFQILIHPRIVTRCRRKQHIKSTEQCVF